MHPPRPTLGVVKTISTCPNCGATVTVTCNVPVEIRWNGPIDLTWFGEALVDNRGQVIDVFVIESGGITVDFESGGITVDFIAERGGRTLRGGRYGAHSCAHQPGGTSGDRAAVNPSPTASPAAVARERKAG
jgi:hypothetical protein